MAWRNVEAILEAIAEHYKAELVQVMLEHEGCFFVEAFAGPHAGAFRLGPTEVARSCDLRLFQHTVDRKLPIIICDASQDSRFSRQGATAAAAAAAAEARPQYSFAALVPLIFGRSRSGTLSVLGAKPREGFTLQESEYLQEKAVEVAQLLASTGSRSGFRLPAAQSHQGQRGGTGGREVTVSLAERRGEEASAASRLGHPGWVKQEASLAILTECGGTERALEAKQGLRFEGAPLRKRFASLSGGQKETMCQLDGEGRAPEDV